jgi:methenyltetrahydromethanopterin cyclohydrolase
VSNSDLSINTLTGEAVDRMVANAARLRIKVSKGEAGETMAV